MPRSTPDTALLLAAGLGQRLAPLTRVRAKPAVPLAGEPIVRRVLRWLGDEGVTSVVLNLHHRPETIAAVVGDGRDLGVHVRYSWEGREILGGAGGAARALPILGADRFFIVNGDTLTDVKLDALGAAHAESGALVTLALTPNLEPARYGGVHVDEEGRVTGYSRRGVEAGGSSHFVGVQVAEAAAFRDLPPDRPAASIGGAYDALMKAQPGSIRGFRLEGAAFWDIGTIADYWRTSLAWLPPSADGCSIGARASIAASAQVARSILWNDVTVEERCVVDECIVTDGVRLAAGGRYRRQILLSDGSGVAAFPLEL